MSFSSEWQGRGERAVLELLAERGEPVHLGEVEGVLRERLQPPAEARVPLSNGQERWWNVVAWGSTGLRAAGWIVKHGQGRWSITDAGRQALAAYPDPEALRAEVHRRYAASRPPKPTRRAWLVRGASVMGENLVPAWLAEGFVSLAASRLTALPPGDGLDTAAEAAYEHLNFTERTEKARELLAFVRKVGEGDLVVTTTGGELYVGDVTGPAEFAATADGRSNVRRAVLWRNADAALDYTDLAPAVAARFQGGGTVIDLTAQLADLEAMLAGVEPDDEAEAAVVTLPRHQRLSPVSAEAVEGLHVGAEWAGRLVDLLNERKQVILYGPPGTGKTFLALALAERLAGPEQVQLIQFHPAYTYEDFFEGYRPAPDAAEGGAGTIRFHLRPGPFRKIVTRALEHPDQAFVLVIDEINRANLAKVFGELYFLLEYRDRSVEPLYSDEAFTLPTNVYLIGTMNTADRSIALLDAAMRRRFAFVELNPTVEPTRSLLAAWLAAHGHPATAARFLDALNARIDDPDAKIGPSYFIHADQSRERIERVWTTSLLPLLREHFYGEWAQRAHEFEFEALWAEATADGG